MSYRNYTYDFWGKVAPAPQAYVPFTVITGEYLGVGELNRPNDLFVDDKNQIYILDSGNRRIIVLNSNWELLYVIDDFINNEQIDRFNNPGGIFVTAEGNIYVADTGNCRVVELTNNGSFIREVTNPWVDYFDHNLEDYRFEPTKVAVDSLGRIYVVSNNLYEGLIVLNSEGTFTGFIGAPRVTPSIVDLFWHRIATEEQRQRLQLFLPTQLRNLELDYKGLIFVVEAGDAKEDTIKRLNPAGIDVLQRNGFHTPQGDIGTEKPSRFFDVAVLDKQRYSVLDHIMGRIFTYNFEGELLYVFGALGETKGAFRDPVALDNVGEQLIVLDRGLTQITVFVPTNYAHAINLALDLYHMGRYDDSAAMWREVLRYNANYDLAYTGVGRSLLQEQQYEDAMNYFKLGNNRELYSKAFSNYRKEFIGENFSTIITSMIIGITLLVFALKYSWYSKFKNWITTVFSARLDRKLAAVSSEQAIVIRNRIFNFIAFTDSVKYAKHVIFHPFDGFWDLKHEKRGSVGSATLLLALTTLVYIFMRQYTGFVINYRDLSRINLCMELASVLVPFFLWCGVNWAFTTLLDGKGTVRDIYISTAYALTPLIILLLPATIISNYVTIEEAELVQLMVAFALLWSAMLLFISNIVVHEYSFLKTVLTVILTLAGIIFTLFLGLLFFSLINIVTDFVKSIYLELLFR